MLTCILGDRRLWHYLHFVHQFLPSGPNLIRGLPNAYYQSTEFTDQKYR